MAARAFFMDELDERKWLPFGTLTTCTSAVALSACLPAKRASRRSACSMGTCRSSSPCRSSSGTFSDAATSSMPGRLAYESIYSLPSFQDCGLDSAPYGKKAFMQKPSWAACFSCSSSKSTETDEGMSSTQASAHTPWMPPGGCRSFRCANATDKKAPVLIPQINMLASGHRCSRTKAAMACMSLRSCTRVFPKNSGGASSTRSGCALDDPGMPRVLKATKAVLGSALSTPSHTLRGSLLAQKPSSGRLDAPSAVYCSRARGVTEASGKPWL
mmetsp:Transcript_6052/g.15420  ORF Transcript_6052/g.15420 Transcript_6052/m.15420 type:complete len:272 (-) Transcript_6052:272-1087(-)